VAALALSARRSKAAPAETTTTPAPTPTPTPQEPPPRVITVNLTAEFAVWADSGTISFGDQVETPRSVRDRSGAVLEQAEVRVTAHASSESPVGLTYVVRAIGSDGSVFRASTPELVTLTSSPVAIREVRIPVYASDHLGGVTISAVLLASSNVVAESTAVDLLKVAGS
jgi:hypothetical protein